MIQPDNETKLSKVAVDRHQTKFGFNPNEFQVYIFKAYGHIIEPESCLGKDGKKKSLPSGNANGPQILTASARLEAGGLFESDFFRFLLQTDQRFASAQVQM